MATKAIDARFPHLKRWEGRREIFLWHLFLFRGGAVSAPAGRRATIKTLKAAESSTTFIWKRIQNTFLLHHEDRHYRREYKHFFGAGAVKFIVALLL